MDNFQRESINSFCLNVDHKIYSDSVISKVLYWLADEFLISRKMIGDSTELIIIRKKKGNISERESENIQFKLNQNFIDFKLRSIISSETQNIRDILYIKAFANSDEFDDDNLID